MMVRADLLQEHGAGEAVEGVKFGGMKTGIWRSANRRLMIMSGADVAIRSSERADGKLSGRRKRRSFM